MLRKVLLLLIVLTTPSFAEQKQDDGLNIYRAMTEIILKTDKTVNERECVVSTTIDLDAVRTRLGVFRDNVLNKEYSIDYYRQRLKQVVAFAISKYEAAFITQNFFQSAESEKTNKTCNFSLVASYPDSFGHDQTIRLVTWDFDIPQAAKVNWQKFDWNKFDEVALNYAVSAEANRWASDEPQDTTPSSTPQDSSSVDTDKLLFLSSGLWHQFFKDRKEGMFRLYAGAMSADGKLVDFPNLMFVRCKARTPYLTLHFPQNYRFADISPSTWLPNTFLYARYSSGTLKLAAELNKNEMYVDLTENIEDFKSILASDRVELRFGPNAASHAMLMFSDRLKENEANILKSRGEIYRSYHWNEIPCVSGKMRRH